MLARMRLLFATDGSPGATIAEEFLLSLPLAVSDEVAVLSIPGASEREAYALLSRCRWRFASRNIRTFTLVRAGASAAEVVSSVALERPTDLVVVGSRGRGMVTGSLMGSVARDLARNAPAPVLVVRSRREAPRGVLLALDGSADGRAAVELVAQLPLPADARITLVHVVTSTNDIAHDTGVRNFATQLALRDAHESEGLRVLEHARVLLRDRLAGEDIVDRGHGYVGEQVLLHAIRTHADLVVLAARGQTAGGRILHTSIADYVLANAQCAVLVAKARAVAREAIAPLTVGALAAS
jgi:nucleotide-binding universal stress UspA family protein